MLLLRLKLFFGDSDNDEEDALGCDPNDFDTDNDGSASSGSRSDAVDNWPVTANPTQTIADGGSIGDVVP